MRIAIAGQAYFQEDNGQAVFTVRLARGLAKAGHEVLAFAPSQSGATETVVEETLVLHKLPAIHLAHNANVSYLSGGVVQRVLASRRPAIIHLQDHYFLCRTVFHHGRRLRIPLVGSNHFLPPNLSDNLRVPSVLRPAVNRLLWWHMKSLYNRLLAISTPTATAAAILRKQGLQPPVTAISCGVDLMRFHPEASSRRTSIRRRYNLPDDSPVLLYIGRIDREKGLDTVVKALAQRPSQDCIFLIGGKGSFRRDLEKLVEELHLSRRVRFAGFVPADDLPLLLAASDCFIMAGHAELQSIATLEAMACGLPVLAADAGALPELVHPGQNGELFAPGDSTAAAAALERFLTRRHEWPAMQTASRKQAEQHGLDATITAHIQWYAQYSA